MVVDRVSPRGVLPRVLLLVRRTRGPHRVQLVLVLLGLRAQVRRRRRVDRQRRGGRDLDRVGAPAAHRRGAGIPSVAAVAPPRPLAAPGMFLLLPRRRRR